MERALLTGAAWGPLVFITCWLLGGFLLPGYSPIVDPISRLAAIGADTRPLMNVGLAAFALGVGLASWPMRTISGPWAAAALGLNALMTVGVLAIPLGLSPAADLAHGILAGLAYASLAAFGILGSGWRRRQGWPARTWLLIGLVTGTALALSATDLAPGLLQRIGLTTTDLALIGISWRRGVGVGRPRPG